MPTRSSQEKMDILYNLISDNQSIKKKELVELSGLKLCAVTANICGLREAGRLFTQKDSGKDRYYTMEYALANDIKPRVFNEKRKREWIKPNLDPSLLSSQLMFNQLYSGLSH